MFKKLGLILLPALFLAMNNNADAGLFDWLCGGHDHHHCCCQPVYHCCQPDPCCGYWQSYDNCCDYGHGEAVDGDAPTDLPAAEGEPADLPADENPVDPMDSEATPADTPTDAPIAPAV